MNQTDIDRLKEICENEGFEIVCQNTVQQVFQIKIKKDPWEGVEFIRGDGTNTIRKVVIYDGKLFSYFLRDSGNEGRIYTFCKSTFKPSTEAAYVEQLKKEAFERYGEIKDGDRFDRSKMDFMIQQTTDVIRDSEKGFNYRKEYDRLFFGNLSIYNRGKWAKKLPERVKVWFDYVIKDRKGLRYQFTNKSKLHKVHDIITIDLNESGSFLASQLEKYLNNEIKE